MRAGLSILAVATAAVAAAAATAQADPVIYSTYGVHNPPKHSPCAYPTCVYTRGPGEPTNPEYPAYWTSRWQMFRVFRHYVEHSPPYDGAPPAPLKDGVDYQTSWGTTYYDSTWKGPSGEGAMEEYYEKFCIPIFPIPNNFTCAFISLGNTAYFLTYDGDRLKGMPPVCLFSDVNHPPRRDFITHLPYSKGDSDRLGGRVQGYSFWIGADGKPVQTGVSPDRTADQDVMFGYAFWSKPAPDSANPSAAPYRHPQSFYFSGYPLDPPNAAIVSQNYTDFAMVHPDPKSTWDQVKGLDPKKLPRCQLFNPPSNGALLKAEKRPPTWADIGSPRR